MNLPAIGLGFVIGYNLIAGAIVLRDTATGEMPGPSIQGYFIGSMALLSAGFLYIISSATKEELDSYYDTNMFANEESQPIGTPMELGRPLDWEPYDERVSVLRHRKRGESFGASQKTKEEIISYLLSNCEDDEYSDPLYHTVNDKKWTLADLFIRQWLNNGWDGFGMNNVEEVYGYLVDNKELLIEYDLVSPDGNNNSGFPLWRNYDFEAESFAADEELYCCICGVNLLDTGEKYGHNPDPIARLPNVCCGDCNAIHVIPARLKQMGFSAEAEAFNAEDEYECSECGSNYLRFYEHFDKEGRKDESLGGFFCGNCELSPCGIYQTDSEPCTCDISEYGKYTFLGRKPHPQFPSQFDEDARMRILGKKSMDAESIDICDLCDNPSVWTDYDEDGDRKYIGNIHRCNPCYQQKGAPHRLKRNMKNVINAEEFGAEKNYCYKCGLPSMGSQPPLEEVEVWDRDMRRVKKAYSCGECYSILDFGAEDRDECVRCHGVFSWDDEKCLDCGSGLNLAAFDAEKDAYNLAYNQGFDDGRSQRRVSKTVFAPDQSYSEDEDLFKETYRRR